MAMSPRLLRPRASGFDPDAQVYFNAVAAADGEQLELGVKKAINEFVRGCKQDGIWDAIKASCILAGARTLAGALVPLKGSAPTNNGPFVSGDYNRETGLLGNGSTKYLDSNRNNNADPQNSKHISFYASTLGSTVKAIMGTGGGGSGSTNFYRLTANEIRMNSSASNQWGTVTAGFTGCSRAAAAGLTGRSNGTSTSIVRDSQSPISGNIHVFAQSAAQVSDARLAFYSIGESLDLARLDTRVTNLITEIGAAI